MKKNNGRGRVKWFLMMMFFMFVGQIALAGVSLGGVIDKSNWQSAQGLVPDQMLDLIKKGDFIINTVDKVNIDTANRETGFFVPWVREGFKNNIGKYDLDEKNLIIDAKTGQRPKFVVGWPFPIIDPKDPKAGAKVMMNKELGVYAKGNVRAGSYFTWIGRSGFEREMENVFIDAYYTGFPAAEKLPNPDGIERYNIMNVVRPYDLAGTTVMLWRYLSDTRDVNFSYLPVIRRVRRMSPASRSDALLGSDFAQDDILGYEGKVADFEWKLIEKKEALVPFFSQDPVLIERNEKGEYPASKKFQPIIYGYQKKGWNAAPWCPINSVYTKRSVYVIELKPKDPYYNYGTQYLWMDAEASMPAYKLIFDRGGKFWKFVLVHLLPHKSSDGKLDCVGAGDHVVVDVLRDHATRLSNLNLGKEYTLNAVVDYNDFTLAGVQKYCK